MLSMPKCASTSLVRSLTPRADFVLKGTPRLKHMNCQRFHRQMVPLLRSSGYDRGDYELVSLFREPVAWLESWWRYRSRPELVEHEEHPDQYAGDITFAEYAHRFIDRDTTGPVVRGRPARFVALSDDLDPGVDRLFSLEASEVWGDWIQEKVGRDVKMRRANKSSARALPEVSRSLRIQLEDFFAPEYEIYEQLRATGEWAPPRGWRPGSGS